MNYKSLNNLFLRQSYMDSWQEYQSWLEKGAAWDYLILTASNEAQASGYREEIADRVRQGYLPRSCEYIVLPDPGGKRVGSGGATLNVLRHLSQEYGNGVTSVFHGNRILVIHSGGDSKRVPQYSVCGKLFSPVPRQLPDGRPSTLFDEFMISMSAVAGRFEEGMLVLSGDVLLLFNPLQLDFQYRGAAAISIKADVAVGKEHGVFLNDGHNAVGRFLHKQSEEQLRLLGAVNANGKVDLDTGAVLMDGELLEALFSLISVERPGEQAGCGPYCRILDEERFCSFVNERSRISFYGDFLYPLAADSTLEDYYKEAPEGEMCQELLDCRKEIWDALSPFSMKLLSLSPAEFIHFGTTKELLGLVTRDIQDYRFLDWANVVNTNVKTADYAVYNSVIDQAAHIGKGAYIENSIVGPRVTVGAGSILSGIGVTDAEIPEHVVMHGLTLPGEKYVVRIYGVEDNPKDRPENGARWLGASVEDVLQRCRIPSESLWKDAETHLWFAQLYPVCDTMEEAVHAALEVYRIFCGQADAKEAAGWIGKPRLSLYSSFNQARAEDALRWSRKLMRMISVEQFVDILKEKGYYRDALAIFSHKEMTEKQFEGLLDMAEKADFGLKIRLYYALSRYLKEKKQQFGSATAQLLESKCFETIQAAICGAEDVPQSARQLCESRETRQLKESREVQQLCESQEAQPSAGKRPRECTVELPVRVNWGGGWTDTPPYCNENGGIVLNAAIKLNGIFPVQVTIRRLEEYHIEFASEDIGVFGTFERLEDIQDCHNPYDHFALHKAALIACGVVPGALGAPVALEKSSGNLSSPQLAEETAEPDLLRTILHSLGGGIYLSTKVVGIPKGSGLGTSSILAGACVKAIYQFLGMELSENQLYDTVLRMEQIMSTGGGWQDQVGGLCPGIKLITSKPGIRQRIQVERLQLSRECLRELQERFVIIYTGQRRLARNLLRDVVGNYIGGRPESVQALEEMKRVAVLMKYELECGNIDRFAELMNTHWKLSLQLDSGASNTCIDQIFRSCEDLIDGRFIAGAGGGGFLQAILKKGVTASQLDQRLYEVFQDSGVGVWRCEFV